MQFLEKFYHEVDPDYELNFGTEVELPSGRMLITGSFDSIQIVEVKSKRNPLPITVKVRNNKMVHVTHHRNMEEAELAIVALAYFCDSVQFYEDVRREVQREEEEGDEFHLS